MMQYGIERRSGTRNRVGLVIGLTTGEGHERVTTTRDMSAGGVRVCSVGPVTQGQRLLVMVQLGPGRGTVECKGRVCWARIGADGLWHCGIRFLDLSEEESQFLAAGLPVSAPVLAAVG